MDHKSAPLSISGPKCRRDDFVGKLHKLLGTIPVFCLPGNPYICDPCYKKILECYSTWDLGFTSVTDYLEVSIQQCYTQDVFAVLKFDHYVSLFKNDRGLVSKSKLM